MTRTRILLILNILILVACNQTNLLNYKYRKYYDEDNLIVNDNPFVLFQSVNYHKPGVYDDEMSYKLYLTILDTCAAKKKKILNLQTDTLIIKSQYEYSTAPISLNFEHKVTGQVEIITWKLNTIELKEYVIVLDDKLKVNKIFKGTRIFNRETIEKKHNWW